MIRRNTHVITTDIFNECLSFCNGCLDKSDKKANKHKQKKDLNTAIIVDSLTNDGTLPSEVIDSSIGTQ